MATADGYTGGVADAIADLTGVTVPGRMDAVRQSFAADQLRVARELRRLTQGELAAAAVTGGHARGLTSAAISQFERGDALPQVDTITALVKALEVDPEFLTLRAVDPDVDMPAFFRSLRTTPARDRKRARNLTQLVHRLAAVIDAHVGLRARDVPSVPCDPFGDEGDRRAAAERAAERVRKEWGLPRGPVEDMIGVVEEHGVVCTRLFFSDDRVDAFSVNFADHPVAVLATDKDKWDRSRFDAAHELGHLVMHDEAAGVPEAERQANEFAAAFLMPARDIRSKLPDRADWRTLMSLKEEWGTSMASLLRRAYTLDRMAESTYVGANKVMSARGWRRHEPVDGQPERPRMLPRAMRRAVKRGIDPERLRREAVIPPDLFKEICELLEAP